MPSKAQAPRCSEEEEVEGVPHRSLPEQLGQARSCPTLGRLRSSNGRAGSVPSRLVRPPVGSEPSCSLGDLQEVPFAEGALLQHGAWCIDDGRGGGRAHLVVAWRRHASDPRHGVSDGGRRCHLASQLPGGAEAPYFVVQHHETFRFGAGEPSFRLRPMCTRSVLVTVVRSPGSGWRRFATQPLITVWSNAQLWLVRARWLDGGSP